MSVVLMLYANDASCFLTCRLCNLYLTINQNTIVIIYQFRSKLNTATNLARDARP